MSSESSADVKHDADVLIIGAGPSGLTLANYLGLYGVRTLVLEARDEMIDFPRGVGIDDESLRSFQGLGLVEDALPHTSPNHWLRFVSGRGRVFASIEPRAQNFGWPRRNAFIQPLVDGVLLKGLERFEHVRVLWAHQAVECRQSEDRVTVEVRDGTEGRQTLTAGFLIGCDGGRSMVRKSLGAAWEGKSDPTQWLVVDVRDDPVGTPNAYVIGNWRRPHVSIALPHGLRRFEFMLLPGEDESIVEDPSRVDRILREIIPSLADVEKINYIRSRVYTHHARLAGTFVRDRIMIAGDAAHLMPVWQGQGYNSGIRDSTNLGWKLGLVCRGLADRGLLDSYDTERRDHAAAMISISQSAGLLVRQRTRSSAMIRDLATRLMDGIPPLRRYIIEMRYKPMPRYDKGVVARPAKGESPAGTLFIQPKVSHRGAVVRLDDVLGTRFAIMMWGQNPRLHMTDAEANTWQKLGARFVTVKPSLETTPKIASDTDAGEDDFVIGDDTGALKDWFDQHDVAMTVVRPDRFVAAASKPGGFSECSRTLFSALRLTE